MFEDTRTGNTCCNQCYQCANVAHLIPSGRWCNVRGKYVLEMEDTSKCKDFKKREV
jgi:hypothetical protein